MHKYWNLYLAVKQQQLYGPVNDPDFREMVWKRVWILDTMTENGCGKRHSLVWNRVRIWRTRWHTSTKNRQEYPLWVLFTVRDITLPLKCIEIFISKGKDFQLICYLLGLHLWWTKVRSITDRTKKTGSKNKWSLVQKKFIFYNKFKNFVSVNVSYQHNHNQATLI